MSIKKTDKIIAPSRLTDAVALTLISKLDRPDDKDRRAIAQIKKRTGQMGIDGAVAAAQALWETGNLTSPRWNNDYNIAGVAITGDDVVQPFTIRSPEDGIDLYLQCLYSAVKHERFDDFPVPASTEQWFAAVWMPKVTSRTYPKVETIDDLNIIYDNGRASWAEDPKYQDDVPARGNAFMPGLPDQNEFTLPVDHPPTQGGKPVTRGKVPRPPMMTAYTSGIPGQSRNPTLWPDRRNHIIGTFKHTPVGWFYGTIQYYGGSAALGLTDYVMGSPWDGDELDGVICECVNPAGGVVPYANGTIGQVHPPIAAIQAILNKYSGQYSADYIINGMFRSIEVGDGGVPTRDRTAKQMEMLAFLIAWVHSEQAGQSADDFANAFLHNQTGTDHTGCPGQYIERVAPAVDRRACDIMRAYQDGAPLNPPLSVVYPPGWTGGIIPQPSPTKTYAKPQTWAFLDPDDPGYQESHRKNSTELISLIERTGSTIVLTAIRDTPRYATANTEGAEAGGPIKKGTKLELNYVLRSGMQPVSFGITKFDDETKTGGTRIKLADFLPKIQVSKSGTISIRETAKSEPTVYPAKDG